MSEPNTVDPRWCIRDWFPGKLARARIETSESIEATLLRSIRRYSENRKAGEDLAETRCQCTRDFVFDKYQAHTRQAVAFYQAAEGAHYRVSPLLYYYSFSNFADALITLAGQRSKDHGITWARQGPCLWNSMISLKRKKAKKEEGKQKSEPPNNGRFQSFYATVTTLLEKDFYLIKNPNEQNTTFAGVGSFIERPGYGNLRLGHLCQYISDINDEVENLLKQPSRFSTLKLSILKAMDGEGYGGEWRSPCVGRTAQEIPI